MSVRPVLRRLSWLVLPYIRRELPGWGIAYRGIVGSRADDDSLWREAGVRTIRGKWHGYLMELNLANWSERHTYFLGRFYDLPLQILLRRLLQPGDRFVDIGANIGMISLHAASLVGVGGRVDAFEPNPVCVRRMAQTFSRNRIDHVHLHPYAVGDCEGRLTLNVLSDHTGMGTLGDLAEEERALISDSHEVPVKRADAALSQDARRVAVVKIDVEGFELRALRSLKETLQKDKPVVVTEIIAKWLARAGDTPDRLFEYMKKLGYNGYEFKIERRGWSHAMKLASIREWRHRDDLDMVWIHADDADRVMGLAAD